MYIYILYLNFIFTKLQNCRSTLLPLQVHVTLFVLYAFNETYTSEESQIKKKKNIAKH